MPALKQVLIVGAGSIGERHLRCFQATDRVDLALCEINTELRATVAGRYGITRTYADLDRALKEPPDAAVIATPAHLHLAMACRLAGVGSHLLIEKPLSTHLAGVDFIVAEVQRLGVHAMVAYVLRQHPALQAMRTAVQSGRFGRPVQLTAVAGQHFPTYRPAYREIYYANRATGGGAVQDALTHVINAAEWLVGPVDRLVADASHQVLDGVEVEDTVHVMARHGEVLAAYSLNQHQSPNESTITVVCERGTCRFELHRQRWSWMTRPDTPWQEEIFINLQRDDLFIAQANAFLDVIDGRAEPACTIEEAAQTLRVNLAILESVEDNSWKRINGR